MESYLECLRNSKEARVTGVQKARLSEMRSEMLQEADRIGPYGPWQEI